MALKGAHTGFLGKSVDKHAETVVRDFQFSSVKTVPLELLRDKMMTGDRGFFAFGVGVKLDDLHAVKKRTRHRLKGICGSDKQAVGKVNGKLDEMVAEFLVLLRVEHLKKSRSRIPLCRAAHFINLVKKNDRVGSLRPNERIYNSAGH